MNEHHKTRLLSGHSRWARWLQLVLLATLGVGLAITAFFFLVFALVAGAIVVTAVGIRLWWLMRKLRAEARNTGALEGEYTVIERRPTAERLDR